MPPPPPPMPPISFIPPPLRFRCTFSGTICDAMRRRGWQQVQQEATYYFSRSMYVYVILNLSSLKPLQFLISHQNHLFSHEKSTQIGLSSFAIWHNSEMPWLMSQTIDRCSIISVLAIFETVKKFLGKTIWSKIWRDSGMSTHTISTSEACLYQILRL